MLFTQWATLVRYYTKTNATTFTDADILVLANIFKDDIAGQISSRVGEDYFGLRFVRDLVLDTREYELPAEVMGHIKYLEAKLDGVNWVRVNEIDLPDYKRTSDETTIRGMFSTIGARFDMWDQSIFLLTGNQIIDVFEGLKLWAIIFPANFLSLLSGVDMSTPPDDFSHGFPRQFHELLARRVSIAFKSSKDKPIPLSEKEKLYELDLADAISSLKDKNLDRVTLPSMPRDTGEDY